MANDSSADEVFDEEELADGFDEEIVGEEELEDAEDADEVVDVETEDVADVDDVEEVDEDVVPEVVVVEDDDVVDDADIELALDEVLAETIRRTSTPEDDEEVPGEVDTLVDPAETILPKQDDEFRCASCRLLKKTSQLSDRANMLCRDCV
jgi:GTPase Era involved in 16S rRNA processing